MFRLLISLYEFGQFLRILLWISVPLVILSMLVTTWLHYRRKRRLPEELLFSFPGGEGLQHGILPAILRSAAEIGGNGQQPPEVGGGDESSTLDPEQKENIYKGILWMKEKYEQYRDMADSRYEQLKEQLTRTEKKYQELLEAASRQAGHPVNPAPDRLTGSGDLSDVEKAFYPDLLEEKNQQIAFLQQQLDQRIKTYYQSELEGKENKHRMLELEEGMLRSQYLLEEKQAFIDQLEGQLVAERRKIEELVTKLQASSQQLLTIYQELDRSFKPADAPSAGEPLNSPNEQG
ncbi:hypothetical protein [Puia sp.]|uniref:hypothetical protein n=1 Tax=Puia sp. TaxID=2045100 RepID=UPI002F3FC2B4